MVTTAVTHKDRTVLWSIVISVLLHLVLLTPGIRNLLPDDPFAVEEKPVFVEPLEFELVSPPERPTPTKTWAAPDPPKR